MIEGTNSAIEAVKARVERLKTNRAVYFAAKGTMVEVANRVWGQGLMTNGGKLSYDDDYELWAYTPPSPKKVTGKGKPYVDWIVRPESISEKKKALNKSIKRNASIFRRTGSISAEIRGESASQKLENFNKRFGKEARKIKGGWYPNYSAYKQQQGRADAPFELTGRLRKAYLSSNDAPSSLVQISETECNIVLRGEEGKKFEGLTERKGQFLHLNKAEIEEHQKRLRDIYFNG